MDATSQYVSGTTVGQLVESTCALSGWKEPENGRLLPSTHMAEHGAVQKVLIDGKLALLLNIIPLCIYIDPLVKLTSTWYMNSWGLIKLNSFTSCVCILTLQFSGGTISCIISPPCTLNVCSFVPLEISHRTTVKSIPPETRWSGS